MFICSNNVENSKLQLIFLCKRDDDDDDDDDNNKCKFKFKTLN